MITITNADREDLRKISNALVEARSQYRHLESFPGTVPATLDEAYAVQSTSIAAWPDKVVGWKVGGVPESYQSQYNEKQIAGPVFSKTVRQSRGVTAMPVFAGGFAAIEAEFILKTNKAIEPGSVNLDIDSLMDLIGEVYIGVEIASSPLASINDLGPGSIISDFGNNYGVLLGREVKDWRTRDIKDVSISVTINDAIIGETKATPLSQGAFGSFAFLIAKSAFRGITLEAGTLVSTGAITGVHKAKIGDKSVVSFGALGSMDIELVKAS